VQQQAVRAPRRRGPGTASGMGAPYATSSTGQD
jgi:hypothetical protein